MNVRPATPAEYDDVTAILDGAVLETDPEMIREAVAADRALVAAVEGRVLGALVCHPAERGVRVDAVAVRPGRRGQGIGSALVATAVDRYERVTAAFDGGVRPFYESLGFDIERIADGRFRGVGSESGGDTP